MILQCLGVRLKSAQNDVSQPPAIIDHDIVSKSSFQEQISICFISEKSSLVDEKAETEKEETLFQKLTKILDQIDDAKKTFCISTALRAILKEYLEQILISDKTKSLTDDFQYFMKRLRREIMQSSTLMKCSNSDASHALKLVFSFVFFTVKDLMLANDWSNLVDRGLTSKYTCKIGDILSYERALESQKHKIHDLQQLMINLLNLFPWECLIVPLLNNYLYYCSDEQQLQLEEHITYSLQLCLYVLPVPSQNELKSTKVGKLVNKVGKHTNSKALRNKAMDVVSKWKKELSRMKRDEEANERREKEQRRKQEEAAKIKKEQLTDLRTDQGDSHNSNNSASGRRSASDRGHKGPQVTTALGAKSIISSILSNDSSKGPKLVYQKKKCVKFEKDEKRLVQINEQPNAPPLMQDEIIPLREILMQRQGTRGLADMKRADMLNEKSMNSNKQQNQSAKHPSLLLPSQMLSQSQTQQQQQQQSNAPPPKEEQSKIERYQSLRLVPLKMQKEVLAEQCLERQTQRQRELRVMQVIYFRDMLIPSDPLEQSICSDGTAPPNTTVQVTTSESLRHSLEDYYRDWKKDQEDRKKETNTVKTLCETLTQGLYQQSPHVVFKVIGDIRFEIVKEDVKNQLALSLGSVVWSSQILDYQFYSPHIRDQMAKLHEQWNAAQLDQISFGKLLIEFYRYNARQFIIDEQNKVQQKIMIKSQQQQAKNYRTIPKPQYFLQITIFISNERYDSFGMPCKLYHTPNSYCNKGDTCHFIHEPKYQGRDVPREELARIRNANMQKFNNLFWNSQQIQQQQQVQYQQALHQKPIYQYQIGNPHAFPQT